MLRLKTAATVEPVTLAEVKSHANIHSTASDDDTWIADILRPAARLKFEDEAKYLLAQRTYELEIQPSDVGVDSAGNSVILLPVRPALAVVSIGDLVTPDPDAEPDPIVGDWTLDVDERGVGRIRLNEGISIDEETVIEFTAGFADPVDQEPHGAPPMAKLALLALIAYWYRDREAYQMRFTNITNPASFESVVRNFRLA